MDNDSAEVLRRRIIALERRLNDSESELKIVKQNPKYVLIQNIRGLETRMLNVVNENNILRTRNKELKEANKALQEQADRIASIRVHNRFGYDPFDHGRPLV